jgi:protein required for attachment to host cells
MYRACIAVVDATRARLFTFTRDAESGSVLEEMSERADLVNPARHRTPAQLFSDNTGSSRTGGLQYGFDDHRDAHIERMDAEFARDVTAAIDELVRHTGSRRLVLCASPRMLGELRAAELRRVGLAIDELPRDYVKLTVAQLRTQLAELGLLPALPPRLGVA